MAITEQVAHLITVATVVLPPEPVQEAVQHIAHLEEFPTLQPLMESLTLTSSVV